LSGIRSTLCGSGCPIIKGASCWCRWSVGWHPPITARAVFSSPA
jgi:hypothetical protein